MARPKLSALLENSEPEPAVEQNEPAPAAAPPAPSVEAPVEAAEPTTSEPPAKETPERAARPRRTPKARATPAPSVSDTALPPYLRFERKEARLRGDQLSELNTRARQLNKLKDPEADRITDNTLIRVAVDLLLSRADELAGGDEAGLRRSLGLTSGE